MEQIKSPQVMKTRRLSLVFGLLVLATGSAMSQTAGNSVTDLLLSAWSPRNYTEVAVTDQQIDMILQCGIKAPSSRNVPISTAVCTTMPSVEPAPSSQI